MRLTGEDLEELFDAVVPGEAVLLVLERVLRVHLDALDHEADVVRLAVLVEVWNVKIVFYLF